MSTYVYLTCLDHNPPLVADAESGQHLYDLPQIRADIADREFVLKAYEVNDYGNFADYFRTNTARFLLQHKTCRIGIQDEYGTDHPASDQPKSDRHALTCDYLTGKQLRKCTCGVGL